MAHKLPRLSKSLLEQPQLITVAKFREIAQVLENPDRSLIKAAQDANKAASDAGMYVYESDGYPISRGLAEGKVGILRVEGPTTYKSSGWEALCGGCSYQSLLKQMDELCEIEDIEDILMNIDSPGGEAYRMMETSRQLREKADAAGKRLIGYVDGLAASAGYGLASSCHELIANPEASIGSIGVVVSLSNNSKKLEKEGIERKFITAGASKVPFEDDGSFRKGFLEDLQNNVDEIYTSFVSHVSDMRGVDEQTIRDTEAKVFKANKALDLGLIDQVMEAEAFYEYLADASANKEDTTTHKESNVKKVVKTHNQSKEENLMSETEKPEASAANAELTAQLEAMSKQLAKYQAKEEALEREALSTKLDDAPFLSESKEKLVSFFMNTEVSEDSKALMNSVIDSCKASNSEVVSEAANKVLEAEAAVETANAEKEAIKEEFATNQNSIEAKVKDPVSSSDILSQKIAAKKAALRSK